MSIAWWPAAGSEAWSWAWRAYPGVWLAVAAAAGLVTVEWRRAAAAPRDAEGRTRLRRWCAIAGCLVLWVALDWPLGTLAVAQLSAAALQYLLISLVVAPLLLFGRPVLPAVQEARGPRRIWTPPVQLLTGAAFAAVLFGTSAPIVVDALRPSALGSMLVTLLWLGSALALWWPVLRRGGRQLRYMAAVAYLFVPFILPKIPGLVYIVADNPIYAVYRDAPRVAGLALSVGADQRLAGALLWSAGTVMIFVSLGVLFAAWYRDERRATAPASLQIPADPELVAELFAIPGAWLALERVIGGLETSLPAERHGFELRVAIREVEAVRRVIVELHAPLDTTSSATVAATIARDFERYLARVPASQRALLQAHLDFEVVPFRTRTS
jgi:cytochrome c oxidase assembly factor CtaG